MEIKKAVYVNSYTGLNIYEVRVSINDCLLFVRVS